MNRIDEMLRELCSDGVEFRPLGEVAVRQQGIPMTASRMKEIGLKSGEVKLFAAGNNSVEVLRSVLSEDRILEKPSVIVKSRGHIGFEYCDRPFQHKSELWSCSARDERLNIKFISYVLTSRVRLFQKVAEATSVKLPQLSVGDTDRFLVPVPPLEVQREIVRILDSFTELEAELEARRKQYAFYRDQLLNFESAREAGRTSVLGLPSFDVEWATLGKVSSRV